MCASSLYVRFEARRESPVPAMMLIGECVQVASDNAAVVANTAALVRASCHTELLAGVYRAMPQCEAMETYLVSWSSPKQETLMFSRWSSPPKPKNASCFVNL